MKAKQFLNKFLYASSDIKRVFIHRYKACDGIELYLSEISDPTNKENAHADLMDMTVSGFRIKGDVITIYVK